jgi:hypothetical protein
MMTSIAAMTMTQRFSVRVTTSSGTMPSGSGRCSGFASGSANGASRQKEEEIEGEPADEQQRHGDAGDDQRADRSIPKRLGRSVRSDRCGDILRPVSGGVMCLVRLHALVSALQAVGIFSLSAQRAERDRPIT